MKFETYKKRMVKGIKKHYVNTLKFESNDGIEDLFKLLNYLENNIVNKNILNK